MSNILDGLLGSLRSWRKRRERELWRNPEWAYNRIVSQIDRLDREMKEVQRHSGEVSQADLDLYHRLQRLEQEAYFRVYNFAQIASELMREWEREQERFAAKREKPVVTSLHSQFGPRPDWEPASADLAGIRARGKRRIAYNPAERRDEIKAIGKLQEV